MIELLILAATTFAVCAVAGLIPVLNTEIYLIGVSALVGPAAIAPLAIAAAAGAMVAKVGLYLAGRGAARLPRGKLRGGIDRLQASLAGRDGSPLALIFTSAVIGLPPFYLVAALSGALRISPVRFAVVGFFGRGLRFAACLAFPQLVLAWL